MTSVTLVKGTKHGEWADPGSPFRTRVLEPAGFSVYPRADWWTGNVSGLPRWLNWWASSKLSDWRVGGDFLADDLAEMPYEDRNIISHSHGLQPVIFAARQVPIRRLIDVCGPVRKDMDGACASAKKNIGYWVHVASKGGDRMQYLGEAFDGMFGWVREYPRAHDNIVIEGIGHSGLLYDERLFPLWGREQILAFLTAPDEELTAPRIGGESWV
jgi:hypothetical protein